MVERRMTEGSSMNQVAARHEWSRLFSAVDRKSVCTLAEELGLLHLARPTSVPSAGIMLLKLREGVELSTFYLGEIPVSRATVTLQSVSSPVEGGAIVMDDDANYAVHLAILDAVLAHHLKGWEKAVDLLEEGRAALTRTDELRREILARTEASFDTMSEASDVRT